MSELPWKTQNKCTDSPQVRISSATVSNLQSCCTISLVSANKLRSLQNLEKASPNEQMFSPTLSTSCSLVNLKPRSLENKDWRQFYERNQPSAAVMTQKSFVLLLNCQIAASNQHTMCISRRQLTIERHSPVTTGHSKPSQDSDGFSSFPPSSPSSVLLPPFSFPPLSSPIVGKVCFAFHFIIFARSSLGWWP